MHLECDPLSTPRPHARARTATMYSSTSPMPRSATVASAAWQRAFSIRLPRWACRASAMACTITSASLPSAFTMASRSRNPTTGCATAIRGNWRDLRSATRLASAAASSRKAPAGAGCQRHNCGPTRTTSSFLDTAPIASHRFDCGRQAGRELRLKQEYLLVSASLQDILARHFATHWRIDGLAEKVAIHLNDTHPALAVPELLRLLLDQHGLPWD